MISYRKGIITPTEDGVNVNQVGIGKSGALFTKLKVVAKLDNAIGEAICADLGKLLGVPTVPGVITWKKLPNGKEVPQWNSVQMEISGLPRGHTTHVYTKRPELFHSIAVFDAWIGNEDRHDGNWTYNQTTGEALLFDHDMSWVATCNTANPFGSSAGNLIGGWNRICDYVNYDSYPDRARIIQDHHCQPWIERIRSIPEWQIRNIVQQYVGDGMMSQVNADYLVWGLGKRSAMIVKLLGLTNHPEYGEATRIRDNLSERERLAFVWPLIAKSMARAAEPVPVPKVIPPAPAVTGFQLPEDFAAQKDWIQADGCNCLKCIFVRQKQAEMHAAQMKEVQARMDGIIAKAQDLLAKPRIWGFAAAPPIQNLPRSKK